MTRTAAIGAAFALLMTSTAFAQTEGPQDTPAQIPPPPPALSGEALPPGPGEEGAGPGATGGDMQRDRRERRRARRGDDDRPGMRGRGMRRDYDEHHGMDGRHGGMRDSEGAFFRFNGADGGPTFVIQCADRDTTLECANAIAPLLERFLPDANRPGTP